MKRVMSLLAVVCVVSSLACAGAGDEALDSSMAPELQAEEQRLVTSAEQTADGRTSEGGTSDTCPPIEYPATPPVPTAINLDTWDFAGTPLLPTTTATQSLYLIAFESPVDEKRLYVYGVDVVASRFIFTGTIAKRFVGHLTQRAGIDIGHFQLSGGGGHSGVGLEIEGPTPPPPPPNINDPFVENYGPTAFKAAVKLDKVVGGLHL
jgi:hypothetical protein